MEELIYWGKKLYDKGLSPAATGNISKTENENILITGSGTMAGYLTPDDIVKINYEGNVIEGSKNPSSEKFMHIKIYQKRTDIKAIIHSHAPELTAFAVSGKEINKAIIPELPVYFGKVPVCKYFIPSGMELAEAVSDLFEKHNAVLMQNHGIVIGAKDLKTCFCLLETLQMYAKIYLYSKILGGAKKLNKNQIEKLKRLKK